MTSTASSSRNTASVGTPSIEWRTPYESRHHLLRYRQRRGEFTGIVHTACECTCTYTYNTHIVLIFIRTVHMHEVDVHIFPSDISAYIGSRKSIQLAGDKPYTCTVCHMCKYICHTSTCVAKSYTHMHMYALTHQHTHAHTRARTHTHTHTHTHTCNFLDSLTTTGTEIVGRSEGFNGSSPIHSITTCEKDVYCIILCTYTWAVTVVYSVQST